MLKILPTDPDEIGLSGDDAVVWEEGVELYEYVLTPATITNISEKLKVEGIRLSKPQITAVLNHFLDHLKNA